MQQPPQMRLQTCSCRTQHTQTHAPAQAVDGVAHLLPAAIGRDVGAQQLNLRMMWEAASAAGQTEAKVVSSDTLATLLVR
jgi:hypothetical protein